MKDPIIPNPKGLPSEVIDASVEAVHAAKNAAQAVETARALQAAALSENATQSLVEALRQVFGEGQERQRFIDITRIPLICQSIIQMGDDLKEMNKKLDEKVVTQDQFAPVKIIAYGLVTSVMLAVLGAILALVLHQPIP